MAFPHKTDAFPHLARVVELPARKAANADGARSAGDAASPATPA